jgi:hypothetical protein
MVSNEELATKIDVAEWSWLRAHLERGGLIVVDGSLDLAEVGVKVVGDDAARIGAWIKDGLLGKPSAAQIEAWDADQARCFDTLIVSPYVLIQERTAS